MNVKSIKELQQAAENLQEQSREIVIYLEAIDYSKSERDIINPESKILSLKKKIKELKGIIGKIESLL
ncbi:MAG: hypothetical protein WC413_04385 [Candidatus Nanoarchaeia archaeon]